MYKLYKVGWCVRDEIMGVKSNDIDYSVVFDDLTLDKDEAYNLLVQSLEEKGVKIFLKTPECMTIRGLYKWEAVDFVIARKETYIGNGRVPKVQLAWLYADLQRRDFTMNAIAKTEDGKIVDFFHWVDHIKEQKIVAVGNPMDMLQEDSLRMLRAIRFSLTIGFDIDKELAHAMITCGKQFEAQVSIERVYDEFMKAHKKGVSSIDMIDKILPYNPIIWRYIRSNLDFIPKIKYNASQN